MYSRWSIGGRRARTHALFAGDYFRTTVGQSAGTGTQRRLIVALCACTRARLQRLPSLERASETPQCNCLFAAWGT